MASKSKKIVVWEMSALDGATRFQEAVEIATIRRQEAEKECQVHYRALLREISGLAAAEEKRCVVEATEAYREMLVACRMRFEAELRAGRVILDVHTGRNKKRK